MPNLPAILPASSAPVVPAKPSFSTANFDKMAANYDLYTPIQHHVAQILSENIIKNLVSQKKLSQKWLDIGCGTGSLSQALFTQIAKNRHLSSANIPLQIDWYGLDNAANMLLLFEQNFQKNRSKIADTPVIQPHPLLADMQALPLPSQSVNLLISSFALHWVGEAGIVPMVAEIAKVVRAGGQIHVAIPVAGSLSNVQACYPLLPIFEFASSQQWLTGFSQLLKNRHGTMLYQQTQTFSHHYPTLKSLLTSLKMMGGTGNCVKNNARLTGKILRQYLQDAQPIALDYQVLFLGIQLA